MTLIEQVQLAQAACQSGPPERRVFCNCGCGAWWYRPRVEGRPRAYLNDDHYQRERNRRRRKN